MKWEKGSAQASKPRRLHRVISAFLPRQRKIKSPTDELPQDLSPSSQWPEAFRPTATTSLDGIREAPAELEGGFVGYHTSSGAHEVYELGSSSTDDTPKGLRTAMMSRYQSMPNIKAEQERAAAAPVRHYQPATAWSVTPAPRKQIDYTMPITTTTTTGPAAWHRRRAGPPPPLTITPPVHSRSPSDAYSTWASPEAHYGYYAFNMPSPAPSHNSGKDAARFPQHPPSSAASHHSFPQTRYPHSPVSPGSAPAMSRSNSGARTESLSLPPSTPTTTPPQSQAQRAPIDSTTFECLGPLPADMPLPSPAHFSTTTATTGKPRAPSPKILIPEDAASSDTDSLFNPSPFEPATPGDGDYTPLSPMTQDPLLFVSNLLPSTDTKANITTTTFAREHSTPPPDFPPTFRQRRNSSDSLGSNFTVEEEARIQAQIVKNLSMLGQERVVAGADIVHIPQISARRYSWEEER